MERQINHSSASSTICSRCRASRAASSRSSREPLDLAFVLQSAIDTSRPAIEAAGHELDVDLPPEPLIVYGDAVRLTQVFANLLTNAAKYTNAGGRHLGLACSADDRRAVSRFATTASASPPTSSRRCSTCSRRSIDRAAARRAGSASA